MKNDDLFYQKLVEEMNQTAIVAPQSLGPFTFIYKRITPYVKEKPWLALGIIATFLALMLYLLLGPFVVRLASILQFGF